MIKNRSVLLSLMICFFILSACSTTDKRTDSPAPLGDMALIPGADLQQPMILVPVKKTVFISKPVVRNLLKKAERRSAVMDYDSAVHLLERGIAISPNNPILWQRMAMVRLKQGNLGQATQLAKKSNVLVEANEELRLTNLKIIREAKRQEKVLSLGGRISQ